MRNATFAGPVQIVNNAEIGESIYQLVLGQGLQFQPGQFLTICCGDAICPKPFAILVSDDKSTEILYKVRGGGTEWLAQRKPAETVYMVGPLGNSFSLAQESKNLLFVAGGMGIVPLLALAKSLAQLQSPPHMTFLYGAKTIVEIVAVPQIPPNCNAFLVTENGGTRYKGLVTDFLPEFLDREPDQIFACGPRPMLAKMVEIIEPYNIPCQVALETYMGCGGQGRCFGCAVPKRNGGYFLLCQDGPVFDLREVAPNEQG